MKTSDKNNTPDFQNLFESAPGLYLVLSPDLKIVAASNAYLNATKTKREAIIGRGVFDVFPDNPDDPTATGVGNLSASLNRVLHTKTADTMAVQKYDIPRLDSEGSGFEERYWSPLNTPVFGPNKELSYVIHQVEDVTEFIKIKQKHSEQDQFAAELRSKAETMEAEIFRRAQEIQETNRKLREAEKVKNEFFANVSHELRTPLSLILAPLESILSGKYGASDAGVKKLLTTIQNNATRLLQLVNGLLDFAKVEAGKMKVNRQSTDIAGLIKMVLNDFESMLNGKKIQLTYSANFDTNYVLTDRYLLERILFNLLSNAVKFTLEGTVSVTAHVVNDTLTVSVKDTGIGISTAELENLFQRFNQAEGSSTRRFEGTGLGLAMIKEFTELLGGSVLVESEVGKGTTFTIQCSAPATSTIPSDDPTEHTITSWLPLSRINIEHFETGFEDDSKMKVLVCEDNPELLSYIVTLLCDQCSVKTANNGSDALALVASWHPDLVLCDVMMPEKDGISVCREIKSNPATSKIMVVLLTALTHRDAMIKGWEAKADEYLFKPFHPEELVTRINSLLSKVREQQRSDELLSQKNEELMRAYKDLESFSYSVSHDLRAPLRAISGYSKILEEDYGNNLDSDGKELLYTIQRNTNKMNKLIEDLLSFSKLDKKELVKSEIDASKLVQNIVNEINYTIEHKADIKLNPLPSIKADHNLLGHVWVNLLSNAIKYSAKKENPSIEIGCSQTGNEIVFFVKDNGSGFDMNYRDKLFGVFQRLHKSSDFEGTGIGLALVKRIITKHGGRVWAEGEVDHGATFYFSVPT